MGRFALGFAAGFVAFPTVVVLLLENADSIGSTLRQVADVIEGKVDPAEPVINSTATDVETPVA